MTIQGSYKISNLDTAVILGALHGRHNGFLTFSDEHLLATAYALEAAFTATYKINLSTDTPAIGRFTDDKYFGGNPWYVTTEAFSELYYRVATDVARMQKLRVTKNNIEFLASALSYRQIQKADLHDGQRVMIHSALGQKLTRALVLKGDGFLSIIRQYVGSQGEMSEQFDRDAGVPVSAPDLTWSYGGFLSAIRSRAGLNSYIQPMHPHSSSSLD